MVPREAKQWVSWQMTYSINKMHLHTQDTFKKVGPGEEVGEWRYETHFHHTKHDCFFQTQPLSLGMTSWQRIFSLRAVGCKVLSAHATCH